jgi:acyl carrier protein
MDHQQHMIDYIIRELVRRPGVQIDATTPLISSGLIDSLALVNVLAALEDLLQMRIPAGKIQPKDMDTVQVMLETARRVGRPWVKA